MRGTLQDLAAIAAYAAMAFLAYGVVGNHRPRRFRQAIAPAGAAWETARGQGT